MFASLRLIFRKDTLHFPRCHRRHSDNQLFLEYKRLGRENKLSFCQTVSSLMLTDQKLKQKATVCRTDTNRDPEDPILNWFHLVSNFRSLFMHHRKHKK